MHFICEYIYIYNDTSIYTRDRKTRIVNRSITEMDECDKRCDRQGSPMWTWHKRRNGVDAFEIIS